MKCLTKHCLIHHDYDNTISFTTKWYNIMNSVIVKLVIPIIPTTPQTRIDRTVKIPRLFILNKNLNKKYRWNTVWPRVDLSLIRAPDLRNIVGHVTARLDLMRLMQPSFVNQRPLIQCQRSSALNTWKLFLGHLLIMIYLNTF